MATQHISRQKGWEPGPTSQFRDVKTWILVGLQLVAFIVAFVTLRNDVNYLKTDADKVHAVIAKLTELTPNLASIQTEINHLNRGMMSIQSELSNATRFRYTSEDARADKQSTLAVLESMNKRVDASERRLTLMEDSVAQIANSLR